MASQYAPGSVWQHRGTREPVVIKYTTMVYPGEPARMPQDLFVCFRTPDDIQWNISEYEFIQDYELCSLPAFNTQISTAWDRISQDEEEATDTKIPWRLEGPFLVFDRTYIVAEHVLAFQPSEDPKRTTVYSKGQIFVSVGVPTEEATRAYLEWWGLKNGV